VDQPTELAFDLEQFNQRWELPSLVNWLEQLPGDIAHRMSEKRYGDLPRWRDALAALPQLNADATLLNQSAVGCSGDISQASSSELERALRGLHPWRKGPFSLFDVTIDTEWRSDFKWDRLQPALRPLAGKRVLDVGCGNGYHCWRMLGQGADEVIGIDPTPLFVLQFKALQHYLQCPNIHVLPLALEHLPAKLEAFDTVFSMGVLYHRKSPIDHLSRLRECLAPGGQLILETLVVEGDAQTVFMPPDRYARMGNVWFLPSAPALGSWLKKLGFVDVELVDINQTSTAEQRSTSWMTFHSLSDFLDPDDSQKTIEGHSAPQRAILSAVKPG
jgi:tRNA (mo5U34)-methyltransferase|tara:strand:+ start:17753 stop:18745 length:993 start_codon:yes stop_codon:yes gene_type:complete